MDNKTKYSEWAEAQQLPVFMQTWWLEGACAGKDWDVLLAEDAAGRVQAAMPYQVSKHWWQRYVSMPIDTHYAGIWYDASLTAQDRDGATKSIQEQIETLGISLFSQRVTPGQEVSPLWQSAGYRLQKRVTYLLQDTTDLEKVRADFSRSKRHKLEKTEGMRVSDNMSGEAFYRYHRATLEQKHRRIWYTREFLLVMAEKAIDRDKGRFLQVTDKAGEVLAASFVVWDDRYVYVLFTAFDHDLQDCGAREQLVWEMITLAHRLGLGVDFLSGRDYLKAYGAKRTEYVALKRSRSMILQVRMLWKRFMRMWDYR